MWRKGDMEKLLRDSNTIHNLMTAHWCSYLEEVIIAKGDQSRICSMKTVKYPKGTGSITHWVMCLLCEHEDQSLDPQEPHKQPDVPISFFSYRAWGQRRVNPWGFLASQFSHHGALQVQEETWVKKWVIEEDINLCPIPVNSYIEHIHAHQLKSNIEA